MLASQGDVAISEVARADHQSRHSVGLFAPNPPLLNCGEFSIIAAYQMEALNSVYKCKV